MERSTIGERRLFAQRITHPPFKQAGEVVAWLGAMQGQDFLGTKWAFGVRIPGSTEKEIDRALASGEIVRVWAMRRTLFYVHPADVHAFVGLIAPDMIAASRRRYDELGLDSATLARSTDLISRAVQDSPTPVTRSELVAMLNQHGLNADKQRGYYMLMRAGFERAVVQGPMKGAETTFIPLASAPPVPREQAAAELARRYFTSRGPVTYADFVHWSALKAADARPAFESAKSHLLSETVGKQTYWFAPDLAQPPERAVYLLPGFDEFVLGYRDRSAILEPAFADAICPGGNGVFMPTIVVNGRIVGTWKRTLKSKTVVITFQPFQPLDPDTVAQIEMAAANYGAFLERSIG